MTAPALLGEVAISPGASDEFTPHVVAWNLTRRCNLECSHCYISAGPAETAEGELATSECLGIIDQILELNSAPLFILSGGEPLLRRDLGEIAAHAVRCGATVVVGTNGTLLTDEKIRELKECGVSGVAVSIDSLDPRYHDRFRRGHGSLGGTLQAVDRMVKHELDFIVQTTITRANHREAEKLVAWAADQGAVSFNAYFLVSTGRGARMSDLAASEYEDVLSRLVDLHLQYLGTMMVRAKCAPHFMRLVHQRAPGSPILNYGTRCPCGTQYCRVTPDGLLTPCPYLPVSAGDLKRQSFGDIWHSSELFRTLRAGTLGGKCGDCEYRTTCGGCRARAYAATGDYMASDPSCDYQPPGDRAVIEPTCPVTYGTPVVPSLSWTAEAEERIKNIPSFVRGVVVARIEEYARRSGKAVVTADVMREVRRNMPVDFSKKMPFFTRDN
ncbi:MAG: radical SAM protein [Gemmatimonadales bacterium]